MTSSINLKKIFTVGVAAVLAIGGALGAAAPAQAAVALGAAPIVTPLSATVANGSNLQATGYSTFTGVPGNYGGGGPTITGWKICASAPTVTSSFDGLDVPSSLNCQDVYTFLGYFTGTSLTLSGITALGSPTNYVTSASLVGQYVVRFEMSKNLTDQTIYGWVFSTPKQIIAAPTMTGPSGNVNGTVGTPLSMGTYTTTGLTSPVVYSIMVMGGSLPAGVTFDTTTGQLVGTPTANAMNLGVTITATGFNSATISSSFNFTVTGGSGGGGGGGGGGGPTPCNPAVTVTSITASPNAIDPATSYRSIFNGDASIGSSSVCYSNAFANTGYVATLNGAIIGTAGYSSSISLAITSNQTTWAQLMSSAAFSGVTVRDGDIYKVNYYVLLGHAPTLADTPTFSRTITLYPSGVPSSVSNSNSSVTGAPLTPEQARNQVKPLPTIVQPLVAALPMLKKPMVNAGGKLDLTAGNFAGLVSASISGKPLDLKVGSTGGLTITVPNGDAGKTADLVLTFSTGTVILQDAIKYVAPVVVANVPVRSITIAAGAKKLTNFAADQVRFAALSSLKNDSIECIGYAASASATAAAKATAEQACALAVKSNPDLVNTSVTVVVDKTKAATQGVGIRVYKK